MSFEIGKPISEKLSTYLCSNLNQIDRAKIAAVENTSPSTIRDLIKREAIVTEKKLSYVYACLSMAIKNAGSKMSDYRDAKDYMEMEQKMAEKDQKA